MSACMTNVVMVIHGYTTTLVKVMGDGWWVGGWGGGGLYQSHEAVLKWNLALNYHFSEGMTTP